MNSRQEKNFPVLPTSAGPIKICTLWDFMQEVKHHKLHSDVAREIAIMMKNEANNKSYHYQYGVDLGVVTKSIHTLKQNPMRVVAELRKTTGLIDYRGKSETFYDLIDGATRTALYSHSIPTHLFAIGKSRFCLLNVDDVSLYVGADYNQTLVCHRKDRNFTIYAPNIRLEF